MKHIPHSSSLQRSWLCCLGCRDSLAAEPAGARTASWDGAHPACYCWHLTPVTAPGAVMQPYRKCRADSDLPACSFPPLHRWLLIETQEWGKTWSIYTRYMTHITIFYLGFFLYFPFFCLFVLVLFLFLQKQCVNIRYFSTFSDSVQVLKGNKQCLMYKVKSEN